MPLNSPTDNQQTGCLYVVATPIGHLEDMTFRAIKILKQVNLIAAEDTRHTRRLMTAYQIENQLVSYHEHNEQQRTTELLERLIQGASIALVSDAGTPGVSDPGYRLIQTAADHDIPIIPIPGVSAVVTALSASGLPFDSFTFVGFPARKRAKRLQQLQGLSTVSHTLVFYQSPRRIIPFLQEVLEVFGNRRAVLARELTKVHEEFLRGTVSNILEKLSQRADVKGECTLLVSGASDVSSPLSDLDDAIAQAVRQADQSLSDLAKDLARQYDLPRAKIYNKLLLFKKKINEPNK